MTEDGSTRLKPPRSRGARIFFHLLASVAVAGFYAVAYVYTQYGIVVDEIGGPGSGRPLESVWWGLLAGPGLLSVLLILIRNSLLTFFFLSRRFSSETSGNVFQWFIAIGGTFIGYLFTRLADGRSFLGTSSFLKTIGIPEGITSYLGIGVMIVGTSLSIIAVSSLGRSFGIVPSNRGIRTGGFYRFVRHPAYGSYFICDLGFCIIHSSPMNILVFIAFMQLSYYRSIYEEQLLMGDPDYQAYYASVKWRFIPGIW